MSMHSDNSRRAGWLVGAVKNNPEGLLLLAAGCALLMRSAGGSRSRDLRRSRIQSKQRVAIRRRIAGPDSPRKPIRDRAKRRRVCCGCRRKHGRDCEQLCVFSF